MTLLAPVPVPRAIFGIGLNYADHVREIGGETPERPLVFTKLPSSAAPPNAPVHCPAAIRRLDYEGELAVVMGPGRAVAGYAVADDVTGRDLQGREPQWTRAKGADGFCPYGPWITTADEVPDPHTLALRTWVNGELRQDSNTVELIFSVPELIEFISETCTIQAGDLILTGTPAGVGQGQDPPPSSSADDVVRIEIEGLGAIEHAGRLSAAEIDRRSADRPWRGRRGRPSQWLSSTRSIRPYSSACSAVKKRSRSMSARTSSAGLPVCSA